MSDSSPLRKVGEATVTCTCGCVYGATVEVWPHGSKGEPDEPQEGHIVNVVDIDGRKHVVVVLDA